MQNELCCLLLSFLLPQYLQLCLQPLSCPGSVLQLSELSLWPHAQSAPLFFPDGHHQNPARSPLLLYQSYDIRPDRDDKPAVCPDR